MTAPKTPTRKTAKPAANGKTAPTPPKTIDREADREWLKRNTPTADVITRAMRERAQALIADPDVLAFIRETWRLYVVEAESFECLGPVEVGAVKYMSGCADLLEIIAGNEDAEDAAPKPD